MKMRLAIGCLGLLTASGATVPGGHSAGMARGRSPLGSSLAFEARDSCFVSRGRGYAVSLAPDGIELTLDTPSRPSAVIRITLDGGSDEPRFEPLEPLVGKAHHFIGSDPARWRTNGPMYGRVRYREAYP